MEHRFIEEADSLTMETVENRRRLHEVSEKLDMHRQVSKFRKMFTFVAKAKKIFDKRLDERLNENG